MDSLCLFPGQGGAFRHCHASLEGMAVPAVPLRLFPGERTERGPATPPSPEHSLHLTVCGARRPLVGCRRECRLQGPRAARLPPEEGAWRLLVLQVIPAVMELVGSSSLSPRRGWWARTGRGPAPSAGKPRPSAEPTLGLPTDLSRWGQAPT